MEDNMIGKTIDELKIGDFETFSKTISEADIRLFAEASGDFNPVHLDPEFAKATLFKKRIAHGFLVGGLISTVIGMKLPGPGTIYREQQLQFRAPVYIGDTVTARVEVTAMDFQKNRVSLNTTCVNQDDVLILSGCAEVHAPKPMPEAS